MPQKITKSVKSMVEAAKREIEEIEAADAVKLPGAMTWCWSTCATRASWSATARCPAPSA